MSAPEIHHHTLEFIDLWRLKAQKANGRPFRAEEDINIVTFDIVKAVAFGKGDAQSMTRLHTEIVRDTKGGGVDETETVFAFPAYPPKDILVSHNLHQEAVGASLTSPSPALFHKINNLRPQMQEAYDTRHRMVQEQIKLAVERQAAGEEVKSALDYMIKREVNAAAKASRQPILDSPQMQDELYGYIGAGHETTSTSFQWAIKHLSLHPQVQQKLRQSLRAAYADAAAQHRQPTVTEITKIQVPYLDAVIEESLRLSGPITAVVRQAQVDTTILGHHVPKGVEVLIPLRGPSITQAPFTIDESLRSESSRYHSQTRGSWDDDPESFIPERWLKYEKDAVAFDSQAGPFLAFSSGIRGCFGRRLAYLQLKVLTVLLVWNLELESLPEELQSFDAVDGLMTKPSKRYVRISEAR